MKLLRYGNWNNVVLLPALLLASLLLVRPLAAQGENQCVANLITITDGVVTYNPLPESTPDLNVEYDGGVIGGWYSLASGFVNVVRPGSLPYDTIRSVLTASGINCPPDTTCSPSDVDTSNPLNLARQFGGDLALFWAGIIAVTIIGALLSCGFCITGCCFWCCRCCGNCGGSKTQKVSDNMDCKTFTFTIVLILVTLFLSVGVVLAFFSNEQTFDSVAGVQTSINTVAQHGVDYVTDTVDEVVTLACQLAAEDGVATAVFDEADRFSNDLEMEIQDLRVEVDVILNTLNGLAGQLNSTQMILGAVGSTTALLLGNVTMLQTELDSIRTSVESLNTECTTASMGTDPQSVAIGMVCQQIPDASIFDTGANYTMLPDVNQPLNDVQTALDGVDLDNLIATGREEFNTTSSSISSEVSNILQDSSAMLEQFNGSAISLLNNLTGMIDQYTDNNEDSCPGLISSLSFTDQTLSVGYVRECVVNQAFDTVEEYDRYRYGFGIAICSLGIVVVVLVAVGIILGMAGFRKDREPSSRTRLSHCGGIFLLIGVAVTFLIGSLLLILATIFFFFGASFQKACLSVEGPEYPLFEEIIDNQEYWNRSLLGSLLFRSSDDPNAVLSISQALRNCEDDMPLYQALNLTFLLPNGNISAQVESLVDFSEIRAMVDGFIENATDQFDFDTTSFLPQEAQDSLNNFVDANVSSINITEYRVQLEAPLLQFNLTETIQNFTRIRNDLNSSAAQTGSMEAEQLRDDVDAIIVSLMNIDDSIPNIQAQVDTLDSQVTELSGNIETVVMDTIGVVDNVTSLLNDITSESGDLRQFLDVTAVGAIDRTIGYLEGYISRLDTAIANEIGRCRPIYSVYTTFYNSVCREFLDGLNGFWWSLGFCSLLFIPVIIFSVITATFYLRKKTDNEIDSYSDYPMKSY